MKDFQEDSTNVLKKGIKSLVERKTMLREIAEFDKLKDLGVLDDYIYNELFDFNQILYSTEDIIEDLIEEENLNLLSKYIDFDRKDLIKAQLNRIKIKTVLEDLKTDGDMYKYH